MADKPKVVAEVESREVTIDQRSGVDEITVKGKIKGFGQRFRDYISKSVWQGDVTVNTGQYPEGHPRAGRWAIQIMIDDRNSIRDRAHRLAPVIWSMTDPKGIITLTERRHWVRFCPTGQREARAW